MKLFIVTSLFLSTAAFASVSDFAGQYEVVSGADGTVNCTDIEVVTDVWETRLQIYTSQPRSMVEEFRAINKGSTSWQSDLNDTVLKGKSTTVYDGDRQVTQEVRTLFNTQLYKKVVLTLDGDYLTIQRIYRNDSRLCVLKKRN